MIGRTPAVLAMAGRGSLPYASLHKVPLYLHALQALAASGDHQLLVAVDAPDRERVAREVRRAGFDADVRSDDGWWERVESGRTGLLVHDALCPLASGDFIRGMHEDSAARPEVSLLAFRPVTDTVKTVVAERIHGTIDREGLAALVSPALLSPEVLDAALQAGGPPPINDFADLAVWLRGRGEVELVRAPSLARRVEDASAVNLLECVDELARRVRREPGPARGVVTDAGDLGTR